MLKIPPIYNNFGIIAGESRLKPTSTNNSSNQTEKMLIKVQFSHIKNPYILSALQELNSVKFNSSDVIYLRSIGVKPAFDSGEDAVKFLSKNKINILFKETMSKDIFAQYNYQNNEIVINKEYKEPKTKGDILAISEAIMHEAGHAVDNDFANSVQEEINNLGINVLTHKFYEKKYPNVFEYSNSPLVKDGVNLYAKLFFDPDPDKQALVNRLKTKYGYLPSNDTIHPASYLALRVKAENNIKKQFT